MAVLAVALVLATSPAGAAFVDQTAARLPVDSGGLYAAVAADVDGDRDADLVLATQAGLRLLLNSGAGVFTEDPGGRLPALTEAFLAVAVGDVDGDGDADLFAASADGTSRLLLNGGTGTFSDATAARLPAAVRIATGAVFADLDGDGDLDLAVACRRAADRLLLNNGAGTFSEGAAGRLPGDVGATSAVAAADLDGDGSVDLVFTREDGSPRLLLNDGLGSFADASAAGLPAGLSGALGLGVTDVDADGDLDLVLAGGTAGLGLLLNDGAGHFAAVAPTAVPLPALHAVAVAVGDLNEDGLPDLVAACAGQDRVLLNAGGGLFADDTANQLPADTERTFGVLAVDVDGDLDLDLVLARPGHQTRLLTNPIAFPRVRVTALPALVEVGQTVAIHAEAFDEDGIATLGVTVNGTAVPLAGGHGTYIPAAPGLFTVVATATDTLANAGTRQTTFTAVANVVPTVSAGPDATAFRGQPFTRSGSFTDPGADIWTATVDYGDGSGVQPLALAPDKTFQLSHVYNAFGAFTVTVSVNDGDDTGTDTLVVTVTNQPPVVASIPPQVVQAPLAFAPIRLDDYVTDPDHADAEIVWTATGNTALTVTISAARVATIAYAPGTTAAETITFTATDPLGAAASASALFSLVAFTGDALRPVVTLTATPPETTVGVPVALAVTIADASPILTRSLTVNGAPLQLQPSGEGFAASLQSAVPGIFTAEARAMDNSGNEGYAAAEIRVLQPGDTTPPVAAITAPADDTVLRASTNLTGTATDANLVRYLLEYSPKDENAFVVFAVGTTPVTNGVLGELDTTLLDNGQYDVRLTVEDASGNAATALRHYLVDGGAKIGDVKLRLADLVIPVAGMDLTVYRQYDSRNKASGDFGVGWSLDTSRITLQESTVPGEGWTVLRSGGFFPTYYFDEQVAHYITVSYPSGRVERFGPSLNPDQSVLFPFESTTVSWAAAPGTTSTLAALTANDVWIFDPQPGPVTLLDDDFESYNPNRYRVTWRDGYSFIINDTTGLESVTDPSGNTLTFGAGGITSSSGLGVVFQRDARNRIMSITDPAGGEISYQYDAYGDLVAVTNQAGGVTRYVYDRHHNLTRIIDPRGNILQQNEFDDDGRLRAILGADGSATLFDHDLGNRTERVTDRLGNVEILKYDANGNITERTDPLGGVHRATFDANNNRTSATDALGNTTTFQYDSLNQLTRKTDPLGNVWAYTYDAQGNLLTTTDPEGNVQTSSYDARGNLLSFADGAGGQMTNTYDAAGKLTSFSDLEGNVSQLTVNRAGHLTGWTGPTGVSATVQTNELGRITREQYQVQTPGGPQAVTYNYTADASGRVTQVRGPHGAVTGTTYDDAGAYTSIGDASGNGVDLGYNSAGRLNAVSFSSGNSLAYQYDAEGRRTRTTASDGTTVERTYDSLGRPITQQAPDGGVTRRGYDAAGHITSVSDPLGHATHYEYDAAGRPTRVTDARGGQTRSEYDGNGYVTAIIDPVGVRTEFDRDAKGRPTAVRFAGGATSTMAYDGNGRLTSRVDPLGNTTTWAYDATGMLQQVTDALGQTTSYERNEEGSITKITEANGAETRLVNDRFRRMVQQTLPLGQTEDRTYDVSGHLVARTDFAGQTSSFAYDAGNGFLTNRTAEDGTTHAFTYSTAGQITSATNENGTWHYQYDAMGRYSRVTEPDGRQVSYTYDLAGRLTAITTPTGTTRYTYDELDRLTGMTDPLGRVTTWTYDAASRLTGSTHANGTTSEYTYDARGLLAAIAHRDGGGTVLFGEIYTRDLRGRITQVERNDGSRVQYAYNAVGWLTSETVTPAGGGAAQTTSYTYDAVGNRTAVTDASGTRPVTCDANGRLFSDGIYTYTYDDNGNVTRRSSAGETLDFAYDGFGKLVRVTRTGGTGPRAIEYRYDPMGALVARVADGVTEKYLVDRAALFHRVLEESDGGGTVTARNFFGVGPELREVGGAWIVLHGDHLSSTRLVTGPTGGLGSQYDYDAFGNLRAAVADNNPYRFAGERYDAGTGAIDLRARFYWPNAGRFLQMDPAAPDPSDQRTIHRYLYASNDPVNLVDPSGRQFDLGSVLISLSISINMMQSFFKYEAIALFMVFAMAGGLEIFDFPAGGPDGSMESRGGAQAFGLGLAVEVWNFNKVPHGRAAFAYAGVSLPFDILSANVGVGEFYVWESRTPNNYEGAFMAFVFSASYLTQVKSRFPRLPVGVGIQGSFEMFFSPIPSADIDESSPTFATYLQSHGIGLGISAVASYGGRGVGGGIGWSFTDYWIIWAQSEKYCKSTRYNRIFGEQTEFDPPR